MQLFIVSVWCESFILLGGCDGFIYLILLLLPQSGIDLWICMSLTVSNTYEKTKTNNVLVCVLSIQMVCSTQVHSFPLKPQKYALLSLFKWIKISCNWGL